MEHCVLNCLRSHHEFLPPLHFLSIVFTRSEYILYIPTKTRSYLAPFPLLPPVTVFCSGVKNARNTKKMMIPNPKVEKHCKYMDGDEVKKYICIIN